LAKRALVTGATGFIGAHLVHALIEHDLQVRCLVRRSSDLSALKHADLELVFADLTQPSSLQDSIPEVDWVFHLAGLTKSHSESELAQVNRGGTHNLLRAIADQGQTPTVVIVSSLAAAGPSADERPLTESDQPHPISSYGRSKLAAEGAAAEFADRVPVSIVRPPIVFGEGDTDVFEMFRLASTGIYLVPVPRGRRYSLIHARDLADFLLDVARRGERLPVESAEATFGTGRYYIGYGFHPTYAELGRRIARALGRDRMLIVRIPRILTYTVAAASELIAKLSGRPPGIINLDKAREGWAGSWSCSPRKAKDQLGYFPRVGLDERLKQTAEWYTRQGWL
jgi:nucleoside-diphosphate-sugar epimerase